MKEELAYTTEKLQVTIEELQSSNEELETSKEELQSMNEESATEIIPLKIGDEARHITDFSSVLIDFDIEKKSGKVLDDLSTGN